MKVDKTVDKWKAPAKNDARLLGMPNIPQPLHGPGCQPRTIVGTSIWNQMRIKCYEDAGYKCEVCGFQGEPGKAQVHCLERGVEVLTINGWKPIEYVTKGDMVAQFVKETNKINFVRPTNTIKRYEEMLVDIGYRNKFRVGYSPNHRILLSKNDGQWIVTNPIDMPLNWRYKIPAAGVGDGDEKLTDNERVYIAINADGSLESRNKDGSYRYRILVSKERKKKRVRELLRKSTLEYWERPERGRPQYLSFVVKTDRDCKDFWKSFSCEMSASKASDFIDELIKWDGWEGKRSGAPGRCWYTTKPLQADFVQAVAVQAGLATSKYVANRKVRFWEMPGRRPSTDCSPQITVEFLHKNGYGTTTMTKTAREYKDFVFCLTVPSHFFVARSKDGVVFITGNCHEVFSINYKTGESKFERLCCLCRKCHLGVIHSGRALTQYGKGMIPFQDMLDNAEHGFKIVSEYNKTHKRQIYMFNTIQEWGSKYPELKEPLARLIKQYGIKFYGVVNKRHGACDWGDWKMIFNGREYHTPYKDASEWEKAMEKMNEKQGRGLMQKRMSGGAFDELDKLLKGEEDVTN